MNRRGELFHAISRLKQGKPLTIEDRILLGDALWRAFEAGALDEMFDLEPLAAPTLSARTWEMIEDYQVAVHEGLSPSEAAVQVAENFDIEAASVQRVVNRWKQQEGPWRVRKAKK